MNNPFTLSFGKKPLQYVSRISQTQKIIEEFNTSKPSNQIYMITGVRGAGKTVMMTGIANELRAQDTWVVVELNPTRDLLQSLAAKLYSLPEMHAHFLQKKIDFSVLGIGVSIENATPVTDIENAIELMLGELQKREKRLLISIDEVTNNESMKIFVSAFQIFIRQEYPLFLLMTGLYDNINNLQNNQSLTFLYRAPKMILEPLNYTAVRTQYRDIFQLDVEAAGEMANLTKGYPFAFQVLGYLSWEYREKRKTKTIILKDIMPEYDQYLEEYVYSKIWAEASPKDQEILGEMALSGETRVKNIRDRVGMNSSQFSIYRDRLKNKGILDTRTYGQVSFALPRFAEFIQERIR